MHGFVFSSRILYLNLAKLIIIKFILFYFEFCKSILCKSKSLQFLCFFFFGGRWKPFNLPKNFESYNISNNFHTNIFFYDKKVNRCQYTLYVVLIIDYLDVFFIAVLFIYIYPSIISLRRNSYHRAISSPRHLHDCKLKKENK